MERMFKWKYLILLTAILLLIVVQPLLFGYQVDEPVFDVLYSILLVATIFALCEHRRHRLAVLLLGLPVVALTWITYPLEGGPRLVAAVIGHLAGALLFLYGVVLTIRGVLTGGQVTLDSIFGAINGYLMLGVAWGILLSMVELLRPGSFAWGESLQSAAQVDGQLPVLLYFSFVTLTTLGYGDVSPVTPPARTLAWLEAILGQLYLAVLVAGLVGRFVAESLRESQAARDEPD